MISVSRDFYDVAIAGVWMFPVVTLQSENVDLFTQPYVNATLAYIIVIHSKHHRIV